MYQPFCQCLALFLLCLMHTKHPSQACSPCSYSWPQMLSDCYQHATQAPQPHQHVDAVPQSKWSAIANQTGSTSKRYCAGGLRLHQEGAAAACAVRTGKAAGCATPCSSPICDGLLQRSKLWTSQFVGGMVQVPKKAQKSYKFNRQC